MDYQEKLRLAKEALDTDGNGKTLIEKELVLEENEGIYEIKDKNVMSWEYYPKEFSSYEEYVKYLKEKGFALEAPEGMHEIKNK